MSSDQSSSRQDDEETKESSTSSAAASIDEDQPTQLAKKLIKGGGRTASILDFTQSPQANKAQSEKGASDQTPPSDSYKVKKALEYAPNTAALSHMPGEEEEDEPPQPDDFNDGEDDDDDGD